MRTGNVFDLLTGLFMSCYFCKHNNNLYTVMGIKDLWSVLEPYMERKPLYELQNKTVAIDLSCWVVEAKTIAEYDVQPRMYLRNLYFRTCYLLLLNVKVVFVLEGQAPQLKHQTIADRNKLQFKGCKPKTSKTSCKGGRTRFNYTLKQCEEMLKLMGLACVMGNGEAEATCAYLNMEELIDGCISQDSDCFAYGAKIVYRNFSISQQGPFASSSGAVDVYNIQKAVDSIDFGRNKIVAMALLCGSDYNQGVHGVGKDSALKFFERHSDKSVLRRLHSWKTDRNFFEQLERDITDANKCTNCGHSGKVQGHSRNGCSKCDTKNGCLDIYKEEYKSMKNELSMRSKALVVPAFPSEELIKEFLDKKDTISEIDLVWKQPDILKFIIFAAKYLEWEELYSFEKIFPILIRWQLLNNDLVQSGTIRNIFYPDYIKKIRNPKGIPSYEIVWKDTNHYFKNIIPEEQLENVDTSKLFSTIDPQELVRNAHTDLIDVYELSKIKTKKPSKRTNKEPTSKQMNALTDMLLNTSISTEPKAKRSYKKKDKNKVTSENVIPIGQTKINAYFKTAVQNRVKLSARNLKIKPCDLEDLNKSMDNSKFGDEEDLANLSQIIDNITNSRPSYLDSIIFEKLTDTNAKSEDSNENLTSHNASTFFVDTFCEVDLFEKSMRKINTSDDIDDKEGNCSTDDCITDNDSFIEIYKPLAERIALKK